MIENPQKFLEKSEKEETSISAAELKKMKRKANKAKAAQEKEKQNGQLQTGGKQTAVGISYLFLHKIPYSRRSASMVSLMSWNQNHWIHRSC
jgi:hypothetical protein